MLALPFQTLCLAASLFSSRFVTAFYSGFVPILFKQIPYTMAKFAVQGKVAEIIYTGIGSDPKSMSKSGNIGVSLASGVVAGVVAAIISHPAGDCSSISITYWQQDSDSFLLVLSLSSCCNLHTV